LKKVMLLAGMLAMVLVAAAPALGQAVAIDEGDDVGYNAVCQNIIGSFGDITQAQYGTANAIAVEDSAAAAEVAQEQGVSIEQVNECLNNFAMATATGTATAVVKKTVTATAMAKKTGTATAMATKTATATAMATKTATATATATKTATATATKTATATATATTTATATATATTTALPPTGGLAAPGAVALGAGVLLVAGGLVARRLAR